MTQETYSLPESCASYLINGDDSGISETEKAEIDSFLERDYMKGFSAVSCSDESYFVHHNDSNNGLAGNVLDYTFLRAD